MDPKYVYIRDLATTLVAHRDTMTFGQLAQALNANGFQTTYNTPYNGGRGVAKLVHSVWDDLNAIGDVRHRDMVAVAFTNANGDYAYD
jgi:hypothetical protein